MYLPSLPSELFSIQSYTKEQLVEELENTPWRIVPLLEALLAKEEWVKVHSEFVQELVRLANICFWQKKITAGAQKKLAALAHSFSAQLLPYFPDDLVLEVHDGQYYTNALLFTSVSPFFLHIFQNEDTSKRPMHIFLSDGNRESIRFVDELARFGNADDSWNNSKEQLVAIIRDAHNWEVSKLEQTAAKVLYRFLDRNTVSYYTALSQSNNWQYLKNECQKAVHEQFFGVELFIPEKNCLGITVHDYRQEAVEFFEKLHENITHIGFIGDIVNDPRFTQIIEAATRLQGVDLTMTTRYPERLSDIPSSITALTLDMCEWLTDERFCELVNQFPNLESLSIARNTQLGYRSFAAIGRLCRLKKLNISKLKQLKDSEMKMICQGVIYIEALVFDECTSLSDRSLEEIARYLRNIRFLSMAHTAISDTGIVALMKGVSSLRKLVLFGCSGITDTGVREVFRRSAYLEFLDIRNTAVSKEFVRNSNKEHSQIVVES